MCSYLLYFIWFGVQDLKSTHSSSTEGLLRSWSGGLTRLTVVLFWYLLICLYFFRGPGLSAKGKEDDFDYYTLNKTKTNVEERHFCFYNISAGKGSFRSKPKASFQNFVFTFIYHKWYFSALWNMQYLLHIFGICNFCKWCKPKMIYRT